MSFLTPASSSAACVSPGSAKTDVAAVVSVAGDYIAEALDKERGSSVTDASIFRAHAAKYEVSLGIRTFLPVWGGS